LIFSKQNVGNSSFAYYKIEKGDNIQNITNDLCIKNIIDHCVLFSLWLVIFDKIFNKFIHYGVYDFSTNQNQSQVLLKLLNGDDIHHSVIIKPGLANIEIKNILNNDKFLSGNIDLSEISEGELYPDTYHFKYLESRQNIINIMHKKSVDVLNEIWNEYIKDEDRILKNKKDLLILASIVEKEAGSLDEMPIIAAVFLNRLKKNMRLQSDPTVIYGMINEIGKYNPEYILKATDLRVYHEFNTYLIDGLPINAICTPSQEAIRSILKYKKNSKYLYFVATKSGKHLFSSTYKQHKINIKKIYGK